MNFVYFNMRMAHALVLFTFGGIVVRRTLKTEQCELPNSTLERDPKLPATLMEANLKHRTKCIVPIKF